MKKKSIARLTGESSSSKQNEAMETVIYFIRHAQRRPSSQIHHADWPLSELGTKQANQLSDLVFNLNVEHVISSPYPRCLDTIKPFIETYKVPMTIHENLKEKHLADTILDNFYDIWVKSWENFDFKIPGCESSFEAQERFVKAVEEVILDHQGKTIAIITHANVLGLFLNYIDSSNHIDEAESIRNPDILRVVHRDSRYLWDRIFRVQGLDGIATHHDQTPMDK